MIGKTRTDWLPLAHEGRVAADGLRRSKLGTLTSCHWVLTRLVRLAAMAAVLVGLLGSRTSVPELVTGEVIETVEVVVSFHGRHHESESVSASDRELMLRKSVRSRGRSNNRVRYCCRHLSRDFHHAYLSVGHRLPDNSMAPLLI